MATGTIALTASIRTNLLSLQNTQSLLDVTQVRLATGLKVNSPLDDPQSYFAAKALNNRASDLSRLLDAQGQAVQSLKTADEGLKGIETLLNQAQSIATEIKAALDADPAADVTAQATSFDDILDQIDDLAGDTTYRGINLLVGTATQTVVFNEDSSSTLDITGRDIQAGVTHAAGGLDVDDAATNYNSFAAAADAQNAIDDIKGDLDFLRNVASDFGANLNVIQARQDFTKGLINTLQTGADNLTLADKNEESAKLLALQTTQQLGITSLSLASQANQSVLRLFG